MPFGCYRNGKLRWCEGWSVASGAEGSKDVRDFGTARCRSHDRCLEWRGRDSSVAPALGCWWVLPESQLLEGGFRESQLPTRGRRALDSRRRPFVRATYSRVGPRRRSIVRRPGTCVRLHRLPGERCEGARVGAQREDVASFFSSSAFATGLDLFSFASTASMTQPAAVPTARFTRRIDP